MEKKPNNNNKSKCPQLKYAGKEAEEVLDLFKPIPVPNALELRFIAVLNKNK